LIFFTIWPLRKSHIFTSFSPPLTMYFSFILTNAVKWTC
jgi:hypothetical protein